ncbi:hypothetical protein ACHHYP_10845 [Achlya hypogyna]|uniref:MSP domain-containing protein n=1 Tax=Achlya hypogyna TaxID=1202772 RepID=A0A1V9YKM2_ACHHY|nr:hypothetical protein ACHHYP_10845 [Achlya hypogyna]
MSPQYAPSLGTPVAIDIDAPVNSPVAFEPADLVVFRLEGHGGKHFRHVTMRNLHGMAPVVFSVKTLNPERYFIKPSKGTIGPGETIQIKIELRQALYDEVALRQTQDKEVLVTDRLLIQTGTPSTDASEGACRESLAFRDKEKSPAKDHAWTTAWRALTPRDIVSKNFLMRFESSIEFSSHTPHVLLHSGVSVLSQTSAFSVDPPPSETTLAPSHFLASIDDSAPLPLPAPAKSVPVTAKPAPKTPVNDKPLPSQVASSSRAKLDRSGLVVAITPSADVLPFKVPPHDSEVGSCDVCIENRCTKVVAYTVRIESKFKCKAVPYKVGWLDGPDKTNVRLELAPSLHREMLARLRSHDASPMPQFKVRVQCMELELDEIAALTACATYDATIEQLKELWHRAPDLKKKVLVHKYVTSFALDLSPVPIDRLSDDDGHGPEGRASEVSECASFQTAFTRAPPMRPIMTPLEHLQYQRSLNQHLLPRNTIDDFRDTLFDDMLPPEPDAGPTLEGVKEGDDEDATSSHLSVPPERPFATSVDATRPRPPSPLRRRPSASVGDRPLPVATTKIDLLAPANEEGTDTFEPLPVSLARPTECDGRTSTLACRDTVALAEQLPPAPSLEVSGSPRASAVRFSLDDIDVLASKYMAPPAKAKAAPLTLVAPPPTVAAPIVRPPAPLAPPLEWAPASPREQALASPVVAVAINMSSPRSSMHVLVADRGEPRDSETSNTVDNAFASFMGPLSPVAAVALHDPLPAAAPDAVFEETFDDAVVTAAATDEAVEDVAMLTAVSAAPETAAASPKATPVAAPEATSEPAPVVPPVAVSEPDLVADAPVESGDAGSSSPSNASKAHTIDDANTGFSILTFPEAAGDGAGVAAVAEPEPARQGSGRSFFPKAILKSFAFKETPDETMPLEIPDEAWIRQSEFDNRQPEAPPKKMKSFLRAFEKNYAGPAPVPASGLVSLTPQTLLYHLDVGKKPTGRVTLQNLSSHCVAFKIKTAQPQRYKVRPNQGYLEPSMSFAIDINLHQAAYDELMCCSNVELGDVRDCLLVETTAVPNKKTVQSLKAAADAHSLLKLLWANTDRKAIHASRLFCEYAFDDSQYHSFSSTNTGASFLQNKDSVASSAGPRLDRIESIGDLGDSGATPPPSPRRPAKAPVVLRDEF